MGVGWGPRNIEPRVAKPIIRHFIVGFILYIEGILMVEK